jgi:hypothetical protein
MNAQTPNNKILKAGGTKAVPTPAVKKGFFHPRFSPKFEGIYQSPAEFDNIANMVLSPVSEELDKFQERSKLPPEELLSKGIGELEKANDYESRMAALDFLFLAEYNGADITRAVPALESLRDDPEIWEDASNILCEYYVKRGIKEKVIELMNDPEILVRFNVLSSLKTRAETGGDVSIYIPIILGMDGHEDELERLTATRFILLCSASENEAVRSALWKDPKKVQQFVSNCAISQDESTQKIFEALRDILRMKNGVS